MDSHSQNENASASTDSTNNLNSSDRGTSKNSQPSSSQYVWSDTKCIEIAYEKSFPKAVKNLAVQKNIITRFFNFYLGANVHKQKGVSVSDLVFSVIAITPLHPKTEQFMWKDKHYHDEGSLFSLALEDKLALMTDKEANEKYEEKTTAVDETDQQNKVKTHITESNGTKDNSNINHNNASFKENKIEEHAYETSNIKNEAEFTKNLIKTKEDDLKPVENETIKHQENSEPPPKREEKGQPNVTRKFPKKDDIVWLTKKLASLNAKAEYKQYGPVDNAAFTASFNKFLEMWDSSQEARISLKFFFGYVALTLLRGTTKTFKHIFNAFSNVRFVNYLYHIRAFSLRHLNYSVPHKRCIKCCYRTFRKRDENMRVMFAKVVINSFFIEAKSREAEPFINESFPPNIMKVSVLTHTAGYGLGLISLIENVAKRIDDLPFLVESTRCKETEPYWEKLTIFFEKYMTATAKQHTHHWARVIDGNYFKDLSCAENYPLAVILALFVEKLSDGREAGIWQSTWITKGENLEEYKKIGLNLYIRYQEMEEDKIRKDFLYITWFRELVARKVAEKKKKKEKAEPRSSENLKDTENSTEKKEKGEPRTSEDLKDTELTEYLTEMFSDCNLEKFDMWLKEIDEGGQT